MFYQIRQLAHPLTSTGRNWELPGTAELLDPTLIRPPFTPQVHKLSEYLEHSLTHGNIIARVQRAVVGPFVTQFHMELKTKSGKGLARAEEYFHRWWRYRTESLGLRSSCRVIPPTAAGQPDLVLEFVNDRGDREVRLREVIESEAFQKSTASLAIPLGLGVAGNPAVADLAALPHLLITGTIGAGKSVLLKGLILGLTFKHTPEQVRFLILAGMPELVYFERLPHLLGPLHYFEMFGGEILNILHWLEAERDARLALIEKAGYMDLEEYNLWARIKHGHSLPRLVVIVDHYFQFSGYRDWRTTTPKLKEVDPIFLRLIQTAHPAGIHLVITNLTPSHENMSIALKESFPAHAGFTQAGLNASLMALGIKGAHLLMRPGDMLFRQDRASPFERYQACNVSADEATRVVEYWHDQLYNPVGTLKY